MYLLKYLAKFLKIKYYNNDSLAKQNVYNNIISQTN